MTDVMTDATAGVALKARPIETSKTRNADPARDVAPRPSREIAHRLGDEAVARALDQAA